jgi:shikimate kinase
MFRRIDAIVLLGPPGCGKSHLGRSLHERGLARFTELEPELVGRFGTGAAFAARKAEALEFIEASHRRQLAAGGLPAVLESTGLSERGLLLRLAAEYRLLLVRMNTPRDVCIARVSSRTAGRNLNNDAAFAASFYQHWHSVVAPGWEFALEVDGVDADTDVARITVALSYAGEISADKNEADCTMSE